MQYKTVPKIVEALEFLPTPKVVNDLVQFTGGLFSPIGSSKKYIGGHLRNPNNNTIAHVKVGDFIIRHSDGTFTAMGRKEFKISFEPK